eukprot:gene7301-biopygen13572
MWYAALCVWRTVMRSSPGSSTGRSARIAGRGYWAWSRLQSDNVRSCGPGRNGSGRGPDAGRTIEFKETDADRRRAGAIYPSLCVLRCSRWRRD